MVRYIFILLCAASLQLCAQDTTLPAGKCLIHLVSGKTIRASQLWQVHPGRLEYLKDENLHDVATTDVSYIHCTKADYELSDSAGLVKIEYDRIVLLSGDTLFGFIREINPVTLQYTAPGDAVLRSVERYNVRKYELAGVQQELVVEQQKASTLQVVRTSQAESATSSGSYPSSADLYAQGKRDGSREFHGNGSLTGGIVMGTVPMLGMFVAPLTLIVPPNTNPVKKDLYNNNSEYRNGYEKGARQKKARRTLVGFAGGALIFLALIGL